MMLVSSCLGMHVLTRVCTVLLTSSTFIHRWNEPYTVHMYRLYYPATEHRSTLAVILIYRPADVRRLSWSGLLVRCNGAIPAHG